MNKPTHSKLALLTVALIGAGVWTSDASASATYHAGECQPLCFNATSCPPPAGVGLSVTAQYVNTADSSHPMRLGCPAVLQSGNDLRTVTSIAVTGFANGIKVQARACRTFGGGGGGFCGAATLTPTGVYNTTITDLSAWTGGATTDGYYVDVSLPGTVSGSSNVLFGYRIVTSS